MSEHEHGYEKTHNRLHEMKGPKGKPEGVQPSNSGLSEGGIPHSKEAHGHGHSTLRSKSDADGKVGAIGKSDATGGREHSNYTQPSGPAGASNLTKSHDGAGHAEHNPFTGGPSHHFSKSPSREAHTFRGTTRDGAYRNSGHSGAHRIGKR